LLMSAGSYPMLRSMRSIHSSVVNSLRRRWYSARSKAAIWMGVSLSTQKGFLPLPSSSYEPHVDLRPDAPGQQPFVVPNILGLDVNKLTAEVVHLGM
jgi:hypothetical protein